MTALPPNNIRSIGAPQSQGPNEIRSRVTAAAVTRRHDVFADPKLQDVLDQIELRAHVELAKLEALDKRVA